METIKGKVRRIIFRSKDSDYAVLEFRKIEQKGKFSQPLVVTGDFGKDVVPEVTLNVHGDYKTHPKYGSQFHSFSHELTFDYNNLSSIKLFINSVAKWIGRERSSSIVDHFGKDTLKILDETPERLSEVPGIGTVSTKSLVESWKQSKRDWEDNKKIYSFKAFLYSIGIKEKRAKKIIKILGGIKAEERVRENPFIITEVDGIGFTTADFVAKQMGVSLDSSERLKAYLIYCLKVVCPFEGHLFYNIDDLIRLTNKYASDTNSSFLGKGLIDKADVEEHLQDLAEEKKVTVDKGLVYYKDNYKYENTSASLLGAIVKKKSDLIFLDRKVVDEHIVRFERENQITLSPEQRDAIHCFAEQKVFVITGSPGTGKTTILKAIVELIKKQGLNLTALTPTGISAKKLATTIDYPAYTIHRRLGYRGNQWIFGENNHFKTDIIIVDESSMIDQELLYRLLVALDKRTHLIFVGDQDQLPSVGAGNVLKEMINSEKIPVVRLEFIFRQKEASDIIKVAHEIRHGNHSLDLFKSDPKGDVFFMRRQNTDELESIVVALVSKFKDERRTFQVITPRNEGPLSVEVLNRKLQSVLNPPIEGQKEIALFKNVIRRGDRVIVKKNDYEKGIFNGDIGKVTSISGGIIVVEIDNRPVSITVEEIEEKVRLAYAITVHKSQGLEYPFIILPMINQFGKLMLQRNLIYTAITRAKEKVIILGHGSAIEKAIKNASVVKRNTILGDRIKKCLVRKKKDSSQVSQLEQEISQNVRSLEEQSSLVEEESSPTVITKAS